MKMFRVSDLVKAPETALLNIINHYSPISCKAFAAAIRNFHNELINKKTAIIQHIKACFNLTNTNSYDAVLDEFHTIIIGLCQIDIAKRMAIDAAQTKFANILVSINQIQQTEGFIAAHQESLSISSSTTPVAIAPFASDAKQHAMRNNGKNSHALPQKLF